jgi:hypothetical protein
MGHLKELLASKPVGCRDVERRTRPEGGFLPSLNRPKACIPCGCRCCDTVTAFQSGFKLGESMEVAVSWDVGSV